MNIAVIPLSRGGPDGRGLGLATGLRRLALAGVLLAPAQEAQSFDITLRDNLGTSFGVMTTQKWWAGYANSGLLTIDLAPDYTWSEPQLGYGDVGFDWRSGPAVFRSNGTEEFEHFWTTGDAVIQNTSVVKILWDSTDFVARSATVSIWGGVPATAGTGWGWLEVQKDGYYGQSLLNQGYDASSMVGRANALEITGLPIHSQAFVLTIAGAAGMPYLGIDLRLSLEPVDGPAIPEPRNVCWIAGLGLVAWAMTRRRVTSQARAYSPVS